MNEPNITSQEVSSVSPLDVYFNEDSNGQPLQNSSQQGSITQEQVPSQQEFGLNTRFRNVDEAEKAVREFQSRYDKLTAEHNKFQKEYESKGKYADLLENIVSDENMLQAFIREVKPDLLPAKDINQMVQEQLAKEFGQDFDYDYQQANLPGRHRQYARRMDELYDTLAKQTEIPTIKQLRESKAQQMQQQEVQRMQALEEIKTTYKVADTDVENMLNWYNTLKPVDLFSLYRNMMGRINSSSMPPNLANIRGSFTQNTQRNIIDEWLK
jgi:archaellum component FlaC